MNGESIAEQLSGSLGRVQDAMTAVENAIYADNDIDGFQAAIFPVGDLWMAAETLHRRIREECQKLEKAEAQ